MSENRQNKEGVPTNDNSGILVTNDKVVLIEEDKINSNLQESIKEIINNHPIRREYSAEDAKKEKPLTHYSGTKNLFQILRFGIHSANFKNRINSLRLEDKNLDELLPYIRTPGVATCGYQGCDSISLNTFEPLGLPKSWQLGEVKKCLFLVNSEIEVWGLNPDERGEQNNHATTIKRKLGIGNYRIGNEAASRDEVLAVNIIKPADILAVIMPDERSVSVLDNIRELSHEYVNYYLRERKYRGKEDIDSIKQLVLADLWVMADVSKDDALTKNVKTVWDELDKIEDREVLEKVLKLQDEVLGSFIDEREVSEENLRMAISKKFGITLITVK